MSRHASPFVRRRALSLLAAGKGRAAVCRMLSLSPHTLRDWIKAGGGAGRVRKLGAAVMDENPAAAASPSAVPVVESPASPVVPVPVGAFGTDGGEGGGAAGGGGEAAALTAAGPEPVQSGAVAVDVPSAPPPGVQPPAPANPDPVVPVEELIVQNLERVLSMGVRGYAAVRRVPWSDDLAAGAKFSAVERAEIRSAAVHVADDFQRLVSESGKIGKVYFYCVVAGVVFGRVQGVNLRARAAAEIRARESVPGVGASEGAAGV